MPSLLYPESAWPNRFGRFVRALQVGAIAGMIGAVGGGAAVLAVMGSGPPHKPTIVGADGDVSAKASHAAKPVGDRQGAPQSSAAAMVSPAPAAASPAAGPPQPAAAPPALGTPQPPQLAAAVAAPAVAAPENTEATGAPAVSEPDNRAKPAERSVHSRSAKLRAKDNRRPRATASRYAQQPDWRGYDSYRPSQRAVAERGLQTGALQRGGGYPYYDSAPRTGYWGGGATFGGGWGNGGWGGGGWGN